MLVFEIKHGGWYLGGHSIIKVDRFAGPTRDWKETSTDTETQEEYDARMRREKEERIRTIEALNQPKQPKRPKQSRKPQQPFNPVLNDYYRRSERDE